MLAREREARRGARGTEGAGPARGCSASARGGRGENKGSEDKGPVGGARGAGPGQGKKGKGKDAAVPAPAAVPVPVLAPVGPTKPAPVTTAGKPKPKPTVWSKALAATPPLEKRVNVARARPSGEVLRTITEARAMLVNLGRPPPACPDVWDRGEILGLILQAFLVRAFREGGAGGADPPPQTYTAEDVDYANYVTIEVRTYEGGEQSPCN